MRKFLLLLCLLPGGIAVAGDRTLPRVAVTAPETAQPGSLVVISARSEKADASSQVRSVTYQWAVFRDGVIQDKNAYIVWPDSSKLVFATGVGQATYVVVLNPTFLCGSIVKDSDGRELLSGAEIASDGLILKSIRVGGVNPGPSPPPVPPPAPDVLPDGKYGLSKFAFDAVVKSGLTADEQAAFAGALASSLEGIAAKINAIPNYRLLDDILKDTQAATNAAFAAAGVDKEKVKTLREIFGTKTYDLINAGSIRNAADIVVAWGELATGLRAIPQKK